MLEAILDRKEKSAEYPSLSFPPRRLPPPPSPYKWAIMDEPDDTRRRTRICDLPEKAVVEIMSWLPPKSPLGLKCVQKSWNNLISTLMKSQCFVATHLKNSKSRPFVFKRTKPTYCFHETKNSFLTVDEADHDNDQIRFHSTEFNLLESVAGSHGFHCDGIVFLPDRSTNQIVLCNPTIREFKLLQGSCFGSNFGKHIMAGFGYDAISNAYKVVRVVRLHSTDVDAPIGAEVCTLGGNHGESWREIKMEIEIDITSFTHSEVYHKGVCYWSIFDELYLKKMLISFYMREERFQTIPFPVADDQQLFGAASRTTIINWRLDLWDERITLFLLTRSKLTPPTSNGKPIQIWILDFVGLNVQMCLWARDFIVLH